MHIAQKKKNFTFIPKKQMHSDAPVYQFQPECAFTQPAASALEQMYWNLCQLRWWNDSLAG